MEIGIEVASQEEDKFVINIFGDRFAVNTVHASSDSESDVKQWVHRIQKTHTQKLRQRKLIVALNADRSFNYVNGRSIPKRTGKSLKDEPYEIVEICVENDVLVCSLNVEYCSWGRNKWFPKALKDLLNHNGVTVVGVGIKKFIEKMDNDYGWIMTNKVVELRDLASQLKPAMDLSRFDVAKLARAVLGDQMNFVKPKRITWWDPRWYHFNGEGVLTEDMIKYATVEVFLVRLMGSTLLRLA